jgi:hypothetical protein
MRIVVIFFAKKSTNTEKCISMFFTFGFASIGGL